MKILFFIESLQAGGKERKLIELIKGLKKYPNFEIQLAVLINEIHYQEILNLKINIHYIERKKKAKNFSIFFRFMSLVRKIKPDLIHVWGNVSAFYAIPAKLLFRKPLINNQITDAPANFKAGYTHKMNFHFSDSIISNSKAGIKSYNAPKKKYCNSEWF
ncbi:MAG: hypothetical protein KAT68_07005 [Bacteroidales bacterium]|nr:hypothetical protein [Bacteroidales bacterium]